MNSHQLLNSEFRDNYRLTAGPCSGDRELVFGILQLCLCEKVAASHKIPYGCFIPHSTVLTCENTVNTTVSGVPSLIFASHVFLYRFWPIPSISSTQARSIRMWPWLPGTLHLTLSIYTRYAFILVIECRCCLNWHYSKLTKLMLTVGNPPYWLTSPCPHICC